MLTCDTRVVSSRIRERTYESLVRLTEADLGTADLIDEAATLLAAAVPHDAGCWHTTDPDSMVETGFRAHNMPPPDAEVARSRTCRGLQLVRHAGRGDRHSGVLSELTEGRLDRSIRYRELLRPNNMRGELRTALVIDGACWAISRCSARHPTTSPPTTGLRP